MSFFSLVLALLIEQVQPLQKNNFVYQSALRLTTSIQRHFIVGEAQYGLGYWCLLVLPLTLVTWGIFYLLYRAHPLLGVTWNVLVLYFTLGFRQVSHYFTDIQLALANQDLEEARRILEEWKRTEDPNFSAAQFVLTDIARVAIEEALVASHRHVFGVLFWFVILPGPAGAVFYRITDYLARQRRQAESDVVTSEVLSTIALRIFCWIDWIPVRMTAIGFAIVGNFEDAIFFWRNHQPLPNNDQQWIILASGSGALGVRLGDKPIAENSDDVEFSTGVEANSAAMRSMVGLVWRSLVLWMILLLLLSVAGLFG